MKASQFQKTTKKILPYAFLIGLILVFTYGFPLTGADRAFYKELGTGGLNSWIAQAGKSGGNYLSALFNAVLVEIPVLRHVLIAAFLSGIICVLVSYCDLNKPYMYFVLLLSCLASSKSVFANTFSRTLGIGTILIPALLTAVFIFTVSDLIIYKGKKRAWKIPVILLSGFASQLFSERIGAAILIVSLVFAIYVCKKFGFSWHLAAHVFGCICGFVLSMVISGVKTPIVGSFYTLVDQMGFALDQIFSYNLFVMLLLTLGCLLLIQPIRTERSKNCNITLYLLLVSMAFFVVMNLINEGSTAFAPIHRVLAFLKLFFAFGYTVGIFRTLQHYVSKNKVHVRIRVAMITAWIFMIVYSATEASDPGMLYVSHFLTASAALLVLTYALSRYSRFEKIIRKPVFIASMIGILCLSCITIGNSAYCTVVDKHIQESLSAGEMEITLPQAPYKDRLAVTDVSQMSDYYDFPSYGNVEISYVPYAQWDWKTYYEAHHVPVIEEYDEEQQALSEWAEKFEEVE